MKTFIYLPLLAFLLFTTGCYYDNSFEPYMPIIKSANIIIAPTKLDSVTYQYSNSYKLLSIERSSGMINIHAAGSDSIVFVQTKNGQTQFYKAIFNKQNNLVEEDNITDTSYQVLSFFSDTTINPKPVKRLFTYNADKRLIKYIYIKGEDSLVCKMTYLENSLKREVYYKSNTDTAIKIKTRTYTYNPGAYNTLQGENIGFEYYGKNSEKLPSSIFDSIAMFKNKVLIWAKINHLIRIVQDGISQVTSTSDTLMSKQFANKFVYKPNE